MSSTREVELNFRTALISGGLAGLSVDVALFPLDTIKTRLQSAQGFIKAGGFHRIYSGLGSAAAGSMPTAAVFFCTYETTKAFSARYLPANLLTVGHMAAASFGEVMACLVRVPVEVVKQRAQTSHQASLHVLRTTVYSEGFGGLYRGYLSTAIREVPFSFIQFPVWEFLKSSWAEQQGHAVAPWQSSVCGAVAGGFAAGLTTPLDVAKTRIMLANTQFPRPCKDRSSYYSCVSGERS